MNDAFQARATAQQIIDYVTVDWVVNAAKELLAEIDAAEAAEASEELPVDSLNTPEP